jgi:hypothetical protein
MVIIKYTYTADEKDNRSLKPRLRDFAKAKQGLPLWDARGFPPLTAKGDPLSPTTRKNPSSFIKRFEP